jgi:hypothetical protein
MYDQTTADLLREQKGLEQERDDLRATGDLMQSSLSRVLEWVRREKRPDMPYEVSMACLEGESAVDLWTEIRRQA